MDTRGQCVTVAAVVAIHIWIHVASVVTVSAVLAINIWIHVASVVTVAAVLAIHIWIDVASVVTVAAVLAIHIWIHVAIGRQWLQCWRYTYGYTWPVGDSGCSAGDIHMDTRSQWVTVAAVLAIQIWIHVASG